MEEIFVTKVRINKVRHLENLEIPLSDTERKHLILTGKNGSGKTSVLEALKDFFFEVAKKDSELFSIQSKLTEEALTLASVRGVQDNKHLLNEIIDRVFIKRNKIEILKRVNVFLSSEMMFRELFFANHFIITHFSATRVLSNFELPSGITKIEDTDRKSISDKQNKFFIQYLVNLHADKAFAQNEQEKELASEIENWFSSFENSLKELFEDETLKLEFDRSEYNYRIKLKDRPSNSFNQLSDGYAALIDIVSELIMRMRRKYITNPYNIQGIVLIDEIETHLHIDLQRKILPFLTTFFPKIQFIVTTHSPFVLNSIDNAVIYDLEKQIRVEDLSAYSYSSIVKGYFEADEYSKEVKDKVVEYEQLIAKSRHDTSLLSLEEKEKYYELKKYFEGLPKTLSPELQLKIQQLELAQLAQ